MVILLDLGWPEAATETSSASRREVELAVSFVATLVADQCRKGLQPAACGLRPASRDSWLQGTSSPVYRQDVLERLATVDASAADTLPEVLVEVLSMAAANAKIVLVSPRERDLDDADHFALIGTRPELLRALHDIAKVNVGRDGVLCVVRRAAPADHSSIPVEPDGNVEFATGAAFNMNHERWLQICVSAMAALGTLMLGTSQDSTSLPVIALIVAGASLLFTDFLGWFQLHRYVAGTAGVIAGVNALMQSQTGGSGNAIHQCGESADPLANHLAVSKEAASHLLAADHVKPVAGRGGSGVEFVCPLRPAAGDVHRRRHCGHAVVLLPARERSFPRR